MRRTITPLFLVLLTGAFLISASGLETAPSTIVIGNQSWCTSNLDVTTYRNGDIIPEVKNQKVWDTLTTGAWCYYKNQTGNGVKYGKLYNWDAVNDPRGLAPVGYHIPSGDEWKALRDTLGGNEVAGKKMKSSSGWKKNGNGTNSSGFTGLPGGWRNSDGFEHLDEGGYWWSSSSKTYKGVETITYSFIFYAFDWNSVNSTTRGLGLSVRCIKD